ncbi:GntR family transcriptional regulator [Gordonia amarae]|uniref:GntR family transcriptional regulator n=1 Tax=Gordonia amarae TaxID=36821 RepID=UPI000A046BFD
MEVSPVPHRRRTRNGGAYAGRQLDAPRCRGHRDQARHRPGHIRPGERLTEGKLSAAFQVSRPTVREALDAAWPDCSVI